MRAAIAAVIVYRYNPHRRYCLHIYLFAHLMPLSCDS